jgi:glucose/arabinose dehydrogenase
MTSASLTNKFLSLFVTLLSPPQQFDYSHFAKALVSKYPEVALPSPKGPTILNSNLNAQVVFRGLGYPTSFAFLGPNDMLVTEKDTGTVMRIVNGTKLQQPLINVNVATYGHRGMLGIAISPRPHSIPLLTTIHGVANSFDSLDQIIFAKGFGAITDLKVNPYDGYLYVLTFNQGTIYRIVPVNK